MTEEKPKKPERKEKAARAARSTQAASTQAASTQVSESVVFIGNKPVMNYVLACLTYLNSGSNKIVVKARGRAIPRAVDTIEVLRRSFAQGLQLEGINVSTEEVAREEGRTSKVSAIEISVTKA
jgi:DNA-binding protein